VTAQDETESLSAVIDTSTSLSAGDMSSLAGGEDLPSPFADIPALVHDHSYLPVRYDGLVDNALVYISSANSQLCERRILTVQKKKCLLNFPTRIIISYDIILTHISGFVVRRALKKVYCDVCRASLVTDAASAIKNQSYHLAQ
jgi:hypothetical protein